MARGARLPDHGRKAQRLAARCLQRSTPPRARHTQTANRFTITPVGLRAAGPTAAVPQANPPPTLATHVLPTVQRVYGTEPGCTPTPASDPQVISAAAAFPFPASASASGSTATATTATTTTTSATVTVPVEEKQEQQLLLTQPQAPGVQGRGAAQDSVGRDITEAGPGGGTDADGGGGGGGGGGGDEPRGGWRAGLSTAAGGTAGRVAGPAGGDAAAEVDAAAAGGEAVGGGGPPGEGAALQVEVRVVDSISRVRGMRGGGGKGEEESSNANRW